MTDVPVELIEKMKKLSESGFEISFKLHRHSRAKLAFVALDLIVTIVKGWFAETEKC